MIPLTPKEAVIRIARHVLGEERVHDHLIKRGIKLRHLRDDYTEKSESDFNGINREADENREECRQLEDSSNKRQVLIYMADGKWMHGGLTDRLRGMASAYKFATEHNLDFKIYHTSPFLLQEILEPNKVNWIIDEKQISKNCSVAKPVLLYREDFNNDSALERQLDKTHQQFHLYSCVDTLGEKFAEYFNDLFKPSQVLAQELIHYESLLGTNYSAFSFRFQNKLGDFKEFTFNELPSAGKQKLLNAALNAIKREIATGSQNKILVTADSPTFLAEAEKLPNVVTVKGKSIHIDFNSSKKATDYLKAFTEFFLISKASSAKLYRNRKYKTYPSNFPKYAASLGNVPYEIIEE
ncbi:hypothetical protein [Fibrobacter sp. UWB12]|uniref:hypothetical protein n=1 Tax=Fibrobacter sp. UWB12 TaxID=1896203 RepID=UPI00091D4CAF|nr:hypothetical protein [Fibrobacter sp. UWB12]SHK28406.1 hypothetical protein SAMN05720759_101499 [Fibrobacter sp. UWB12]